VDVKEFESNQIILVNFRGGTFNSQECCPTFNSLLCPPSPPPTTSITANDFATFFTDKTKTISSQCSPPLTQDLQPTRSTAQNPIFSFCPFTEAEVSKLLLSSHPTTCPLDPIPLHLLQAISPTLLPALTLSTHLSSQASSPLHSSRLGLPHCSKNLH